MSDTLKQIADNLGVSTINGSYLSGIADYYGVDLATSTDLMADILTEVGGDPATSTDYLQDIVLALGGTVTINANWMEAWEAITAVPPVPFTTEWTTTSSSETIELPYDAAGTYSGTIDWGDGNTSANSFANRTHTYATAGTYTVIIDGTCIGWNFQVVGTPLNLTSVVHFAQLQLGADTGGYFYGCNNLDLSSVSDTLDLTGITNLDRLFDGCTSLTTVNNINSWDTSAVTSMNRMFRNATAFNQPLSFDTSAVTNMGSMFQGCSVFNQPLSFDTSAVTSMNRMLRDATAFNQDIGTWNTKTVTDMGQMFSGASAFNQNLGSWNVANVTNFASFMVGKTPATFSTTNLDAIYNGWVTVQSSRTISFGTAEYTSAGAAGRAILVNTYSWYITDGGQV